MKTTIEISDDLLERSRKQAQREGSTLRALVEEGLQLALKARRSRPGKEIVFPVYGGSGMSEAFKDAGWEQIRDEIYRGRGSP
jgi:hypothetical protein